MGSAKRAMRGGPTYKEKQDLGRTVHRDGDSDVEYEGKIQFYDVVGPDEKPKQSRERQHMGQLQEGAAMPTVGGMRDKATL